MYKVFVNDAPIILTDSTNSENDFPTLFYKNTHLEEVVHKINDGVLEGLNLYCIDLQSCWEDFRNHFPPVVAGGGLVINSKQEILFIYRSEKWDLPKGRIEDQEHIRETAVREVEEECGINGLHLQHFLLSTYHLFSQDNTTKLKETHWFFMTTDYDGPLTPQEEEGITNVVFKRQDEIPELMTNSYANIALVLDRLPPEYALKTS